MTRTPRTLTAVLLAAAALAVTACTGDPTPEPSTPPAVDPTTPTTEPDTDHTDDADDAFRVGQAADGGTFEPLTLPDGFTPGDGVIPDDSFLDGSGPVAPGTPLTVFSGYWSTESMYRSTFLFSLDSTTEPLTGADYDAAYDALALGQGGTPHGAPIQQFTYRAREIAADPGPHDASTFDLVGMMTGFDFLGNTNFLMVSDAFPLGCVGDRTPFEEHGWETGDTVQGCGYAVALPPADEHAWFYGIRMNGHLSDDSDAPRMFMTEVYPDNPSAGHDDCSPTLLGVLRRDCE